MEDLAKDWFDELNDFT